MKQETKSHREADRKKEEESDKRIQSWVARKAKQNHLKKELEQKWFKWDFLKRLYSDKKLIHYLCSEKFNRQMALGETQAILKGNAEAKLNEQIAQRVKMTVDKEKKRLEDQYAKKKSREKEIRDFYDNFVRLLRSSSLF